MRLFNSYKVGVVSRSCDKGPSCTTSIIWVCASVLLKDPIQLFTVYTPCIFKHDSTFLPIHARPNSPPPIFLQYMVQVLHAGDNMEFFIEGSRSRSGKPGIPKAGLLSVLVDSVKEGIHDHR